MLWAFRSLYELASGEDLSGRDASDILPGAVFLIFIAMRHMLIAKVWGDDCSSRVCFFWTEYAHKTLEYIYFMISLRSQSTHAYAFLDTKYKQLRIQTHPSFFLSYRTLPTRSTPLRLYTQKPNPLILAK